MAVAGAGLLLANRQDASASTKFVQGDAKPPAEATLRFAPQFYIGDVKSDTKIDVVWSAWCPHTRHLFDRILFELTESVLARNDALVVFHHLARDPEEIEVALNLLAVEPEAYGAFCLATTKHSIKHRRPTAAQVETLRKLLGIPRNANFDATRCRQAIVLLSTYLREREGIEATPTLVINGKRMVDPSVNDVRDTLKDAGYDI